MNLLEVVKEQFPDFEKIDVNPIFDQDLKSIGWECNAYLKDGSAISGGAHLLKETALRICVAEALERALFQRIIRENRSEDFLIHEYPSTCGFAAGFENEKTKMRAICESVERWGWSQWIDFGYEMEIVQPVGLDILTTTIIHKFERIHFFKKIIRIYNHELQFCILVAEKDNGCFPGSRVCSLFENPWQHASIEAFRNYRNFNYAKKNPIDFRKKDIVFRRAIYFGTRKNEAFKQINNAKNKSWPNPKIKLIKDYFTNIDSVFLWRCILHDWISWDSGDEKRFII